MRHQIYPSSAVKLKHACNYIKNFEYRDINDGQAVSICIF